MKCGAKPFILFKFSILISEKAAEKFLLDERFIGTKKQEGHSSLFPSFTKSNLSLNCSGVKKAAGETDLNLETEQQTKCGQLTERNRESII